MTQPDRPTDPLPLKEASVREAMGIIREKGLEHLSLREVARRLNVSHQAPYKHFASKDVLLAEVIRRCLRHFAEELDGCAEPGQDPQEAMQALGQTYLRYADTHPLEYRLMFMTPWPDAAKDLGLGTDARAGFDILTRKLAALKSYETTADRDRDALFVWSLIHGIASILQSEAMHYLSFSDEAQQNAVAHAMHLADLAVGIPVAKAEETQKSGPTG